MKKFSLSLALAAASLITAAHAQAQSTPPKNIAIAGGTTAKPISGVIAIDWRLFGCVADGTTGSPTDNAPCFSAMASKALTDYTAANIHDRFVDSQSGWYMTNGGFNLAQYVAADLAGSGSDRTFIVAGSSFTGDLYSCDDAYGGSQVLATNTTFPSPSTYRTGCGIDSLSLLSTTLFASNAMMFYDNTDGIRIHDVNAYYQNGCQLCFGVRNLETNSISREEGIISNVALYVGGSTSNMAVTGLPAPALGLFTTCSSCSTGSATNHMMFDNLRIYAPASDYIQFCNQNTNGAIHDIEFNNLIADGVGTNTGDIIHIDNPSCGGIASYAISGSSIHLGVPSPGHWALHIDGNNTYTTANLSPHDIDFRGVYISKGGISDNTQGAIKLDYAGPRVYLQVTGNNVAGSNLTTSATMLGLVKIDAGPDEANWSESINDATKVYRGAQTRGTFTANDCLKALDALGNIVDAGSACASGATGTWTPTVTPTTLGDWTVAYGTHTGFYTVVGSMTCINYNITWTGTFTTASGTLKFSLPTTNTVNTFAAIGVSNFTDALSAYTSVSMLPQANQAFAYVAANKSGLVFPGVYLTAANALTGTAYTIQGGGCYY